MTDAATLEMLLSLIQQYHTKVQALDSAILRDVKWLIESTSKECDAALKDILNFPAKDKDISRSKLSFLQKIIQDEHPNTELVKDVFDSIEQDMDRLRNQA